MILEPADTAERLSDEDHAAAERLHAHLAVIIPGATTLRVAVVQLGRTFVARAFASDRAGSRRVESVATAATAREALCDAARQIGCSL